MGNIFWFLHTTQGCPRFLPRLEILAWPRRRAENPSANHVHDSWECKNFSVILFHINISFKLNFLEITSLTPSRHFFSWYLWNDNSCLYVYLQPQHTMYRSTQCTTAKKKDLGSVKMLVNISHLKWSKAIKTGRVCKKKNQPWLFGVDRKICPSGQDHCSASLGKPRDAEQ